MEVRKASVSDLKGGAVVHQDAYITVRLLRSPRIVLLVRTAQAFPTIADIDRSTAALNEVLPHSKRLGLRIVIDMRLAPVRVHPALDPAFERFCRETEQGFVRAAVVVATPLGRVRADRLSKPTSVPARVVGSFEEAVQFFNTDA
jgi:hypothetical protein